MPERIITEIYNIWHSSDTTDQMFLIAIDGRCAAGKTTLAAQLQERTGCNVIHMDDFFLRPEQQTKERLLQPGGNVDWERFQEDVMLPLQCKIPFSYSPYDCHTKAFKEPVQVQPDRLTLVEGAYSCHPQLWDFYNLHIFLTISPKEQLHRIRKRNGAAGLEVFQSKWIPMEELYFREFSIRERCELCYDTKER